MSSEPKGCLSEIGIGHCGKACVNWDCDEEPKWDDLCVGCPCNPETDAEEDISE
jgi:hypothetical protein